MIRSILSFVLTAAMLSISLALSWMPAGVEDSGWIIPGYTFVFEISYDDNVKIYPYFDQPYFQ